MNLPLSEPAFEICLNQVGKRFRYEWIFKNLDLSLESGRPCAILGQNGAGKSTLMKILSGHLTPSAGSIEFKINNTLLDSDKLYKHLSFTAPYIELIEELTLTEIIAFHTHFKPLNSSFQQASEVLNLLEFPKNTAQKQLRFFSSGMKQRVKLALAVVSQTRLILLDEPTNNLDKQGILWYQNLVASEILQKPERLLVVASNTTHDYEFCTQTLDIQDYK
jgi:ABC-type multidrug transport system ATPase subunit